MTTMRPAIATFVPPTDDRLRFIKQLGVDDVILWGNTFRRKATVPYRELSPADKELSFREVVELRQRVEDAGLRVAAVENVPLHFYDQLMLGGPDREEQADRMRATLVALARGGVEFFGYNWMPNGVWRTSYTHLLRGGAKGTAWNSALVENAPPVLGRRYSETEFWENYHSFLDALLPTAEAEGIRLALHPNDPPVEAIGGMPCLFRSIATFRKGFDLRPSPNNGIILCFGSWAETGESLFEVIRHFGEQRKLFYGHFQAVQGAVPTFNETFIDEADHDPVELLLALRDAGFEGVMIPGHVPQLEGDSEWRTELSATNTPYTHPMGGHRGRAYTVGFIKGMLAVVRREAVRRDAARG